MKKFIKVVETSTDRTVAIYPVVILDTAADLGNNAFEREAWQAAIEDGLVDPQSADKYAFREVPRGEA